MSDSVCGIPGLSVGHHTLATRATGCTVVLCEPGAVCGVDVRGGAPGTRETDLLHPVNLVDRVHAVLLSGGSAFGLDAASGVMRWLEERGRGLAVGPARVPIVPAAVLFDLWLGDPSIRPDAHAGYAACEAASREAPAEGSVGAGAGASVGKVFGIGRAMKGGIGSASVTVAGVTVAALIAVNAFGDVVDPATGLAIAGVRSADGSRLVGALPLLMGGEWPPRAPAGAATTIGIVATDARLDKAEASKVAQMSHDGLARSINPAHTLYDGDTMFALATGVATAPHGDVTLIGLLAAEVSARAVVRAVKAASGLPGLPAWRDLPRSAGSAAAGQLP